MQSFIINHNPEFIDVKYVLLFIGSFN